MQMEGKFSNFLSPGSLTGNIPAQQSHGTVLCAHPPVPYSRELNIANQCTKQRKFYVHLYSFGELL